MACNCPQTFSLNIANVNECAPNPDVYCSQGFKVFAPGVDGGACGINPGNVAGCQALVPGCKYRFLAPGGQIDGNTVIHLVWSPPLGGDTISVSDGTVTGIANESGPGDASWVAPNIVAVTPGQVEFDLLVTGPMVEFTNNSVGDLEICAISYQARV